MANAILNFHFDYLNPSLSVKIYLSVTIDGKQLENSDEVLPCVTLLQVAPWDPRSPAAVLPTFISTVESYFYFNTTRTSF